MLTVRQIFDDLLGTLGVDNPDTSSDSLRASVLGYITAGLQLMQLAGEDFYCREELDVALSTGTGHYDLPAAVQTVLKPARLSGGKPLLGLTSRTQLDQFGPLFLGSTSAVADGTPIAYFIEALKAGALTPAVATGNIVVAGAGASPANGTYTKSGTLNDGKNFYVKNNTPLFTIENNGSGQWGIWYNPSASGSKNGYYFGSNGDVPSAATGWSSASGSDPAPTVTAETSTQTGETDSAMIRLHVIPKPAASDTLTLNVINEPPTYTADDLCGTSPTPPVPHKYHESILLPICRMNVTVNPSFARHKDKLPQIQAEYLRALVTLGLADPRKPKPDESNSNRLKALAAPQGGGQ